MTHLFLNFAVFFVLGAVAGSLSGMLGIGGGVIIVPGLAAIFHYSGFPADLIMHVAAGTSLAVMAISMLWALLAHRRYHVEYWSVFRQWLVPLGVGAISGVVIAHYLHSKVLLIILAVVLLLISLKMLLPLAHNQQRCLPGSAVVTATGAMMGLFSGMAGIGGGTLVLTYLTYYNLDMRRAVVVAIAASLTVGAIGAVIAILVGWHRTGLLLHTIGYVYWPAWVGLLAGSFLFVPQGVKLSHRLPVAVLKKLFAVILLFMAIYLLVHSYV